MTHATLLLLALLAAAKPAPAVTGGEPVDLLDFDQGTVLVSATESYGEGVSGWAPHFLSDGSVKEGWCSAQGHPAGNEFVYELEQDSSPERLRLVTAGADEAGYPGISAKEVELWGAGAKGGFEKLGSFLAPQDGAKEFAVVAPRPLRRIKLVVKSNWGDTQYTELMEVDLLGRKVGPAPKVVAGGEFYSSEWNGLRIKQTGTRLEGCYDHKQGTFSGELDGRVAKVRWRETDGETVTQGTATFVVAADSSSVQGIYFWEGELRGTWNLEKPATEEQRPKCTPPGSSLADELAKHGRLVLYGIRFDTNSDVPRADSEATLQQLLELLQKQAGLRLQVEGHTDSTNTDAYNQELSERRAKAVVKWLTGKGIEPARLSGKGFGRSRPIASNDSAQGRALNRRVELAPLGK